MQEKREGEIYPCLDFNKTKKIIGRKPLFCQQNQNKGILLPLNSDLTLNFHWTFQNLSGLHKHKLKVVGTSFKDDEVVYH